MKLKLLLMHGIHATYRKTQMIEMQKSLSKTSLVQAFPGVVDSEGEVVFQCRGKKAEFFFLMLWIQSAFLAAHGALSLGALLWCWKFRDVSNLLRKIEDMRSEWEPRWQFNFRIFWP